MAEHRNTLTDVNVHFDHDDMFHSFAHIRHSHQADQRHQNIENQSHCFAKQVLLIPILAEL